MMALHLCSVAALVARYAGEGAGARKCEFAVGRDYADPAGPVFNATSAAVCCQQCFATPQCVVAVFAPSDSQAPQPCAAGPQPCVEQAAEMGRCYTKTSAKVPVEKGASSRVVSCVTPRSQITDKFYDCPFRQLALEMTKRSVLAGWTNPARVAEAVAAVSNGLRIEQCAGEAAASGTEAPPPPVIRSRQRGPARALGAAAAHELWVAPNGDDSAPGSAAQPLRTIGGAQAHIRRAYPDVASRPAISVWLRRGDYFSSGPRRGPLRGGSQQRYGGGLAAAVFTAQDSGSSAEAPIAYAAEIDPATGHPVDVTLHGGIALPHLNWTHWVAGGVAAWRASLPSGIDIDSQDQLYFGGTPLVRARIPNGRPWLPLDGFNLTAGNATATITKPLPNIPRVLQSCGPPAPPRKPTPHPGPALPSPPRPALNRCSALVSGVTLLSGSGLGPPDFLIVGTTDNATACQQICARQPCCSGFTWHDQHQGQWAYKCYLVTNPLGVWSRAGKQLGHVSGLCNHGAGPQPCAGHDASNDGNCRLAAVGCAATGEAMVHGYVKVTGNAGLGNGSIAVKDCYEHLPDEGNSWPMWTSQGYGLRDECNNITAVNSLTFDQNFPKWQGPWASGLRVDSRQIAGGRVPLRDLPWSDVEQGTVVVHAMADGEWGGVQFRVSNLTAKLPNGDAVLQFNQGGWQQSRGANLHAHGGHLGNRFYMEGSIDFLDEAGEWHWDPVSRFLYIVPPSSMGDANSSEPGPASPAGTEVILTQTDSLLRFVGNGDGGAEVGGQKDGHVRHILIANLTLAHTSAQFFEPHEETSGGDYAITRSAAIFAENASHLRIEGNTLTHIGGNAVFLSNSVNNVSVRRNRLSYLGSSGVLIVGRTGAAMMDARDGELMAAKAAPGSTAAHDNGVRLPKNNIISHNVISDYGVWDKQSAAYHKALAPGNSFSHNVVFNCSRHGVNFQDSMGGRGLVHHNVFFNLNRETTDTAALNSWGRRVYVFSDSPEEPRKPRLVPEPHNFNRWRNNLVLNRNYWGVRDGNGNCLRCDDGASWFNMSGNVCYSSSSAMEFNGGSQVYTHGNLFVQGGWTLCAAPPGAGGGSHDTYIDSDFMWRSICGNDKCLPLWESNNASHQTSPGMCKNLTHGCKRTILRSDYNTLVLNSTGAATVQKDLSSYFCSLDMRTWRERTHADSHTRIIPNGREAGWSPGAVMAKARQLLLSVEGN